jgi:hypothetical protein|tara:strand:+ start:1143 stop:1394 length:252 start_codon:yes stop_codon:yes gene_type:complete
MDKLKTLQTALTARNEEVSEYQINIDNYTRALVKIEKEHFGKPGMEEFSAKLKELLSSSQIEQLKAIIIRDVIAEQITELEAP